jgi:hypothetical protein
MDQAQPSEQFLASTKLASNKAICLKTNKKMQFILKGEMKRFWVFDFISLLNKDT